MACTLVLSVPTDILLYTISLHFWIYFYRPITCIFCTYISYTQRATDLLIVKLSIILTLSLKSLSNISGRVQWTSTCSTQRLIMHNCFQWHKEINATYNGSGWLWYHLTNEIESVGNSRFTMNFWWTWDWFMSKKIARMGVTSKLVGIITSSFYINHQKVISYFWILAITWWYLPLKLSSSTTIFNHENLSWNFQLQFTNLELDPLLVISSLQVALDSFRGLECHLALS